MLYPSNVTEKIKMKNGLSGASITVNEHKAKAKLCLLIL